MSIALYELTQGYRALADLDATDQDVLDALAQVGDAIDIKAENIAKVIRGLEAEAEDYKAEAKKMAEAGQSRGNRAANLKAYLLSSLLQTDLKRAGGLLYVTVQNSPPSAKVVDEQAVSEAEGYKVAITTWRFDNRKAIESWKETGRAPAGFEVMQGQHIVVRP